MLFKTSLSMFESFTEINQYALDRRDHCRVMQRDIILTYYHLISKQWTYRMLTGR